MKKSIITTKGQQLKLSDGMYTLIKNEKLKPRNKELGVFKLYKKTTNNTTIQKMSYQGQGSNPHEYRGADGPYGKENVPNTRPAPSSADSISNLVVGLDSEYVVTKRNNDVLMVNPLAGETINREGEIIDLDEETIVREIVSYQLYTTIQGESFGYIVYPMKGTRLSLAELMLGFIESISDLYCFSAKLEILMSSHFGLVDFSALRDYKKKIGVAVTEVRKSLFTTGNIKLTLWDKSRNKKEVSISIRDTMLLAPGKSSLGVLGEALGFPKLASDWENKNAAVWARDAEDEFEAYAINDAMITYRWITTIYGENVSDVPYTIGNDAANFARDTIKKINNWSDEEFDYYFRGLKTVTKENKKRNKVKDQELREEGALIHTLATYSYYGGRNESLTSGIFKGKTFDYDLKGAYLVALSLLEDPDYSKAATPISGELTIGTINPTAYGFGKVRFEFPDGVLPCLPVRDEVRGLIFPQKGETYASNPEVYLALKLGAKITVATYYMVLGSCENKRSFAEVAKIGTEERSRYEKNTALELMVKERNNSIYGKIGQGLKETKSFNSRYRKMVEVGPSIITTPILAAHVTSLVRALISGTMNEVINRGYTVHSVTTDGFISNIPYEELLSIEIPRLTQLFMDGRKYISGNPKIWEIKHHQDVLINIKTRANIGLNLDDSGAGVFAAGSYAIPREVKLQFKEEQRVYLAELFLNRSDEEPIISYFMRFPSVQQFIKNYGLDFVAEAGDARVNYEYDYKRKPVNIREEQVEINGKIYTHVTFETEPWKSYEEFIQFRDAVERRKRVVKTKKELDDLSFEVECSKKGIKLQDSAEQTKATQILRNIRAGKLPLNIDERELLGRLNEFYGLTLTRKQWNDAGRADRQRVMIDPMLLINDIKEMELV